MFLPVYPRFFVQSMCGERIVGVMPDPLPFSAAAPDTSPFARSVGKSAAIPH